MTYRFMLFALLTLGFTSYAQAYTDTEREAVYAFAKLRHVGPTLTDVCGKAVTPKLSTLALGGSLGDAAMLQVEDATCYGMAGSRIIIFKQEGSRFLPVFDTSAGGIVVLQSQHLGVFDIKPAVPCMKIPVWKWNGKKYEFWKSLPANMNAR